MKKLFAAAILFIATHTHGQPIIVEDRMYLEFTPSVIKAEHDIYLPSFPGSNPRHLIRWKYDYRNAILMAEESSGSTDGLTFAEPTIKIFSYDDDGKLIKDSCYAPNYPKLDYYTIYTYNDKGQLKKSEQTNIVTKEAERINTYQKYKGMNSYQMASQFFDDDNKKSLKYTSVFENGLKKMVYYEKNFSPVIYQYDTTGKLVEKNKRKYFYKLDERGNPIAVVEIERGMRIYNFIRLTYTDGLVTGSLEQDKAFIQKWDNEKP